MAKLALPRSLNFKQALNQQGTALEGHAKIRERRTKFTPPEKYRKRDAIAQSVRTAVQELSRGERPWPLLLWGQVGSGKTCAALCCVDAFGGWYLTLGDLCSMLIDAQKGTLQWESGWPRTTKEIWKDWADANICVLDEVGLKANVSDHHYESFKKAIDQRADKPLIVISNHDMPALAKMYDSRISSRLCAGTVVETRGDRRRNKKLALVKA